MKSILFVNPFTLKSDQYLISTIQYTISTLNQTFSCENKGNDHQPKKLLIGKQILPVSNLEIYSEQKGEYEYWFLGFLGYIQDLNYLCFVNSERDTAMKWILIYHPQNLVLQYRKIVIWNIQMFLMMSTKFHITLPPNDIHYHFTSKNFDVEISKGWNDFIKK